MKWFTYIGKATIVSALLASASSFAVVDLNTPVPVTYAKEIIGPVTLTNAGNILDMTVTTGYSESDTEVRYVRIELNNGATFSAGTTVTGPAACLLGAVNGTGTSVIYFSMTGVGAGCTSASILTVTGNRGIVNTDNNISAAYSLYDTPSQAQAGGATGRIVNKANRAYISFVNSLVLETNAALIPPFAGAPFTNTASVAATPAYTSFLQPTTPATGNPNIVDLGLYSLHLTVVPTNAVGVPYKADGTAITLADLLNTGAGGSQIVVNGDFSARAPNGVYLQGAVACPAGGLPANTVTDTSATFSTPFITAAIVCYQVTGTTPIPASDYTVSLKAVSANPAVYKVSDLGPVLLGRIVRDGTELQAVFAQQPAGWICRFVLSNTSGLDAPFSVKVLTEPGNVANLGPRGVNPPPATNVVKANSTLVMNCSEVVASFTPGQQRGTVIFNVVAQNQFVQGFYQVVNAATGNIDNTPMIRPGTN